MDYNIYKDIATRTGGDIYIGVVGPVRSGKSTFIKRFMETLVLDKIADPADKARAVDELPQSADGKTIMTTEPKFVPGTAVRLDLDGTMANVRLIDCVGYMVEGALGLMENEKPRLVSTPWSSEKLPFEKAAEIGTEKVIKEHSTIGILVTTDGTVTEIDRSKYIQSEERVIKELKALGKPFIVVLNTKTPESADTVRLAASLSERYAATVVPMDVMNSGTEGFTALLTDVLLEFPIRRIDVALPKWMRALELNTEVAANLVTTVMDGCQKVSKMRDYEQISAAFADNQYIMSDPDLEVDSATGRITMTCKAKDGVFYKVLASVCGADIDDDYKLMEFVVKASRAYNEYERIRVAMEGVKENGYGVVMPTMAEMELMEPEIVKRGSQFGVKLRASAPSFHIMQVDVEAEISPIIGSEQQSEELADSLVAEFENNTSGLWQTNMFGKSLSVLVRDDLNNKIANMPSDAQKKLRKTVTRIINEGKGGVLCILL